ncbi:MAG: hypothetical protein LKG27_01950 [Clostridiaceae bacterium]|nr:hypothetical protein [Clostridiaceae bacterium]
MLKISPINNINYVSVGKHIIPRYLYHLTSKDAYESMLKDGAVKITKKEFAPGVFMFDLMNFFKHWNSVKFCKNRNVKLQLLEKINNKSDYIVILRLSTQNIDKSKLKVRTQEDLFKMTHLVKENLKEKNINYENIEDLDKYCKNFLKSSYKYLSGVSASKAPLLKQNKKSIEYVYPEEISIDKFEKIGEANIKDLKKINEYSKNPLKLMFSKLLKGNPEEKSVFLIKE